MPGSYPKFKAEVAAHITARAPAGQLILDVGAGMGTWSEFLDRQQLCALEVHQPYIDMYSLKDKYRAVYCADVRDVNASDWANWGYVVMGDVLEHLAVADARRIVQAITDSRVRCMVAVPYLNPQDAAGGVESEIHLQADLTPVVMGERYPELQLLVGDHDYGYYVNYDPARADEFVAVVQPALPPPVDVVWFDGQRGYWDHGLLIDAFGGRLYQTPRPARYRESLDQTASAGRPALMVVAGARAVDQQRVAALSAELSARPRAALLVVSDEETRLPLDQVEPVPTLVQTPTEAARRRAAGLLLGYRPDTRLLGATMPLPPAQRPYLWSFTGQTVNNSARAALQEMWRSGQLLPGAWRSTAGFGQGIHYPAYLQTIADSHVVLCPTGPATPDSFRLYEALEFGALPIANAHSPANHYPDSYWSTVLMYQPPWPVLDDWHLLPALLGEYGEDPVGLQVETNIAGAWWQSYKRELALRVEALADELQPWQPIDDSLRHRLTVIIPSSVVPAHPSTQMLEDTIRRVRSYAELRQCEVLILLDGIRPEQDHRTADYHEYIRRVLWLCNWHPDFRGCLPIVFADHMHQSGMMHEALRRVQTDHVLYVEHDTQPVGDIDWRGLVRVLDTHRDEIKMVRLHYDVAIHPEHRYLMRDETPRDYVGVPLIRTRQWSQRPHIASTAYYRRVMNDYFAPHARTFIEDVMWGVVSEQVAHYGVTWEHHGLAVYAPAGNMQRSNTCDGRGADPKYTMKFAYRGGLTPPGAPQEN